MRGRYVMRNENYLRGVLMWFALTFRYVGFVGSKFAEVEPLCSLNIQVPESAKVNRIYGVSCKAAMISRGEVFSV
jgi:hypothetical protein